MAKKHQRKQKLDSKPKTYNIKMPVFTTHMMDYEEGFLKRVTYDEMISYLKGKLANYTLPISSDNRNKTKKTGRNRQTLWGARTAANPKTCC